MARLATGDLFARLEVEGELLLAAGAAADHSSPVPGLDWTAHEVLVHLGAVHRWSADIVRRALPGNETGGSRAFHPESDLSDLTAWLREGHAALLDVLREADDDLDAWTFSRGAPAKWFWTRRQAHETAIHRMDVESTVGPVTDVPADFAQDGIDELAAGFARQRAFAVAESGTLLLAATDGPDWLIRFGGERTEAAPVEDATADATVSGRSSDLYRWLWNRPSDATVSGDSDVARLWSSRVRI